MSIFQNHAVQSFPVPLLDKQCTPVACDNGYADQKIAYWSKDDKGKRYIAQALLPSRAKRGADDYYMNEHTGGMFELNGSKWTVASNINEPDTMRDASYATSELNAVLVANSLIATGFSGQSVRLATGLPFSQYWKDAKPNKDLFDEIKSTLTNKTLKTIGSRGIANIEEHEVHAESLAALIDYCFDEEGKSINEVHMGQATVDIGGETTDISTTSLESGAVKIEKDSSGTKRIGVLDVKEKLKELIKQKFNIDKVRAESVDRALLSNEYTFYGETHNIEDLVNEAKQITVNRIMDFVREKIGDASDLDFVLIVGGGAALLKDSFENVAMSKIIRIPEEPQFANARGMLKHMTFISR